MHWIVSIACFPCSLVTCGITRLLRAWARALEAVKDNSRMTVPGVKMQHKSSTTSGASVIDSDKDASEKGVLCEYIMKTVFGHVCF